jgi:hypothetical protein
MGRWWGRLGVGVALGRWGGGVAWCALPEGDEGWRGRAGMRARPDRLDEGPAGTCAQARRGEVAHPRQHRAATPSGARNQTATGASRLRACHQEAPEATCTRVPHEEARAPSGHWRAEARSREWVYSTMLIEITQIEVGCQSGGREGARRGVGAARARGPAGGRFAACRGARTTATYESGAGFRRFHTFRRNNHRNA